MLFGDQINTAQKDISTDINQVQTTEGQIIKNAVDSLNTMLRGLIEGYTIEIKAVKK